MGTFFTGVLISWAYLPRYSNDIYSLVYKPLSLVRVKHVSCSLRACVRAILPNCSPLLSTLFYAKRDEQNQREAYRTTYNVPRTTTHRTNCAHRLNAIDAARRCETLRARIAVIFTPSVRVDAPSPRPIGAKRGKISNVKESIDKIHFVYSNMNIYTYTYTYIYLWFSHESRNTCLCWSFLFITDLCVVK